MEKLNVKSKLKTMVWLLFGAVLIIWIAFYFLTSRQIGSSTRNSMQQVSAHIINALEDEFLGMENLAFSLSQHEDVRSFVQEQDALLFHTKAKDVHELIDTLKRPSGILEHLILYNRDHVWYRFKGSLGNTSMKRIADVVKQQAMPRHRMLVLERTHYLCYTAGIYSAEEEIGFMAMLINEAGLRELFIQYNEMDDLEIALAADDKVMIANVTSLEGKSVQQVKENSNLFYSRRVGFTPFEIVVSSTGKYSDTLRKHFALAVAVTTLLFAFVLAFFAVFWKRNFAKPLVSVAQDIERLGTGEVEVIQPAHEPYFDMLVDRLNRLLARLKEKSEQLMDAQFQLHNAEIEKHKAMILSLKKQINAHFIVNVLNIIRALTKKNELEKTTAICDGLSCLLRYANSPDEWIGGLEEFFVLERYIQIMQIRCKNRFAVTFEVDTGLEDIHIPRMLVQPIIENAIVHGLQYHHDNGRLKVVAAISNGELAIEVSDNGCGMDAEKLTQLINRIQSAPEASWNDQGLEHIALPNIQKRVSAYYGTGYGLSVESKPGEGTTVVLKLPTECKAK